ncbi:MAG: ATP-binding protein [Clostridiaceae bacterium]|nr:ATP-binding protein [Clostridiaceae bacterium]
MEYEKLGQFYLGTVAEDRDGDGRPDFMLFDSRELLTHAICVGMTGSGKTGLGIAMLEEAAMDGIPAIIVDPKGDMGNLLLSFPGLTAEEFRPWVQESEAQARGITADELAAEKADAWRAGLTSSAQTGDRIRVMRERCDFALYTPGGLFGRPLSVEGLFNAPLEQDMEIVNDMVASASSSVLHLIGIDADPIKSREHVLLSEIIRQRWHEGKAVDLPYLIQAVQNPPVKTIGVMDIESFFPEKNRFDLALQLNAILASPSFASFLQGEPLNIDSLLYTAAGKPRLSILSLSHLSEAERMFFLTLLLNQLISWMRSKQGTDSLRALFYMDEIFGYFPPVANPPSKMPLLTLLKQARAYGLGMVLATQNPADLDYKGLSNIGSWFIGRLSTERDRLRLLEGLVDTAHIGLERGSLSETIANLEKRQFLLRRPSEKEPTLFTTRFCMSYLAGPLTREQTALLARENLPVPPAPAVPAAEVTAAGPAPDQAVAGIEPAAALEEAAVPSGHSSQPPLGAAGIPVHYLYGSSPAGDKYIPALLAYLSIHYENEKHAISEDRELLRITPLREGLLTVDWNESKLFEPDEIDSEDRPPAKARYASLPADARKKTSYTQWQKQAVDHAYRTDTLDYYTHQELKIFSEPGETERDFAARVQLAAREERDAALDKLRDQYDKKQKTLEGKIIKAEERVDRETEQSKDAKRQTAISFGSAVLGAFLGKSLVTQSSVGRAGTAAKSASRSKRQAEDIVRAEDALKRLVAEKTALDAEMEQALTTMAAVYDNAADNVKTVLIRPLKRDIAVKAFALLWLPEGMFD